ncbi:sugar ABC transporter permease [Paenibacillaceae bacterium]|nr:sugar ABC transporter permease [Paenibacillaceae bacterium]
MRRAIRQYVQVAPYLMLGVVLTAVFVLYPLIKGIYISFFEYKVLMPEESLFVGVDNYVKALNDPKVYIALRNTVLFAIVTVPGQWLLGIIVAMLVNLKTIRFKLLFRFLYYLPVISSWIVVSYLFKYLFADGPSGIINYLLVEVLHVLPHPVSWLQNTWTASVVVWLVSIWKGIGWVMIMYLASLQSIPRAIYEAAEIDGARGVRVFMNITLPLMRPMTTYVLINLIIGSFQAFIQVFLITEGGPMDSTHLLSTYMFRHAFQFFDFGYAAAISVMMGLLIFVMTYSQQRTFGKERIEY